MPVESLPDFDALWDYDHPAETETRFREIQPLAEASGGKPYRLELLTQIARTLGLQRKFDEAHSLLDRVLSELVPLTPELRRAHVRYLLERGRVLNSSKRKEEAVPLFRQALEEAEAGGFDFYAIDAAHMLGIATPPDEQLAWNLRALEMCELTDDARAAKWRGSLYNNIGWTYHDAGRYNEALAMFERGVEFRASMDQQPQLRIAKWCVARCLRSLERVDEALSRQEELLAENVSAGEPDMYTLEEVGECLYALGRPDEAKPWFARAHAAMSRDAWLVENEGPRLARLKELGE